MDGWAHALRVHFGPELSELIGLHRVVTGEDFEELLGELTRWLQLGELNKRFAWMTSGTDQGRDASVAGFEQGLMQAEERGLRVERALDETLFEQFGPERFGRDEATTAYGTLLSNILGGINDLDGVICATTNYDRSLELALEGLDMPARNGFKHNALWTPTLSADGLGTFGHDPSVLYLHGAVGWYRNVDGDIVAYPAADQYRSDIGRPAVLYPSNNKVVEDSITGDIWIEFDKAMESATHVLVLGHGLADEHLVSRLRTVAGAAVTCHSQADGERVSELLPEALQIWMDFAPEPQYDTNLLRAWATSYG